MRKHQAALQKSKRILSHRASLSRASLGDAIETGIVGYRTCQVTVLAPNGNDGFRMDCAYHWIEPDIDLSNTKASGRWFYQTDTPGPSL
jgi:hypothetical protein